MRRPTLRFCGLLAGLLAALAVGVPGAEAGTFSVRACGAADGVNRSWTVADEGSGAFESPGVVGGYPVCDSTAGLWAQDRLSSTVDPQAGTEVRFTFQSVPGTWATAIAYDRRVYKLADNAWDPAFLRIAETPVTSPLDGRCTFDPVQSDDCGYAGAQSRTFPATARVEFGLRCSPGTIFGIPTTSCGRGATLHHALAQLRAADVTVTDEGSPVVGALGGDAVAAEYLRGGAATVSAPATDASGLRSGRVLLDGAPNGEVISGACNTVAGNPSAYVTPKPCADRVGGSALSGPVDLTGVADGPHTLSLRATDAAGNAADASPRTVTVDQTAPGPPLDLAIASTAPGLAGWELAPPAAMTWSVPPGQVSPVETSHVRACRDGGACRTATVSALALDAAALAALLDQGDGTYAIEVSLGDRAGNGAVFDATRAARRTIRVDGTPPGPPTGLRGGGMHGEPDVTLSWTLPVDGGAPVAGVVVRLCPVDASGPGGCTRQELDGRPTAATVTLPAPDVDYLASVSARDEAGNADESRSAEARLRYHPEPSAPPGSGGPSGSGPGDGPRDDPDPTTAVPPPSAETPGAGAGSGATAPRTPRVRLATARYAPASRRLTLTGTAAAGLDARAVVRLRIAPRARGGRIAPPAIGAARAHGARTAPPAISAARARGAREAPPAVRATRAIRVVADRRGRFTVRVVLAASTGRAIRAARTTTATVATRASARWRAATATRTVRVQRPS